MSDPNSAQSYPLKGPYSQQAVTESIQREQVGLGPYPSRPQGGHVTREGEEEVVDPHKNFHLMSLGKFFSFTRKAETCYSSNLS